MKTEIEIPDGYEIDQLAFKKIEKKLPKTWEELGTKEGYYIGNCSKIGFTIEQHCIPHNKNIFPTKELAEASLALAQLLQLRDAYNDGWVADWSDRSKKYVIGVTYNEFRLDCYYNNQYVMNFKTAEIRDEFFENFNDLLETAKPLL